MRASRVLAMRPTRMMRLGQDMPPVGGYDAVQYKRNLPARGFRPAWLVVGMLGIMAFGWYELRNGIHEWNELSREKQWARYHITPLLQAEQDRDHVRRWFADQAREKELLGTNTIPYHRKRYVPPTYAMNTGLNPEK